MPIETGNYVADLNPLWPLGKDPKSAGDDHIRNTKSAAQKTFPGYTGAVLVTGPATGTASAHIVTPVVPLISYTMAVGVLYLPPVTNTGAVTVNVSGIGPVPIKTLFGVDPTAGDIIAGQPLLLVYTGTNFIGLAGSQFLSKTGNAVLTGTLTISSNVAVGGTLSVTGPTTLPQATTIGTTTATELGYISGVTSPIQTQINTKGAIAGQVWTGAHDFTAGSIVAPTRATNDNSTNVATTAFVSQVAFQSALPAQILDGLLRNLQSQNGTVSWGVSGIMRSARTSNTVLSNGDIQKMIDITSGSFTQTFAAAATLGNGWYCQIKNSGTNPITLDPNGSELIDGALTKKLNPDEQFLVLCDGTAFYTYGQKGYRQVATSGAITGTPTTVTFNNLISEDLIIFLNGIQPSGTAPGANSGLLIAVSTDNGATFGTPFRITQTFTAGVLGYLSVMVSGLKVGFANFMSSNVSTTAAGVNSSSSSNTAIWAAQVSVGATINAIQFSLVTGGTFAAGQITLQGR